jgi:hypothetical protein
MAASDLTVTVKLDDLVPEAGKVIAASERYADCLAEFDGEDGACGEWRDAWIDAVDALKKARAEQT